MHRLPEQGHLLGKDVVVVVRVTIDDIDDNDDDSCNDRNEESNFDKLQPTPYSVRTINIELTYQ